MDGESAAEREERLQALWRQLDTKRKGYLDLPALKSGLAQMNHREFSSSSRTSNMRGKSKGMAAGRTQAKHVDKQCQWLEKLPRP